MGNDGPSDVKYQLYLMKQRGEKIDPNNLPPNKVDNQKIYAKKKGPFHKKPRLKPAQPLPIYESQQNKLADELVEWSKGVDMVDGKPMSRVEIRDFFDERNLLFWEFKKKAEDNPYMAEALEKAKQRLSANVRKDWFRFKGSGTAAHTILRELDKVYKEAEVEESNLKKGNPLENVNVFMSSATKPDEWVEVRNKEDKCLKE